MSNAETPPAQERRGPAQPLPAAQAPFDAIGLARQLLRGVRSGALATIDAADGTPFASLVTLATDSDGTPLMLLSRLSAHTRNLDKDPRASLLFSVGGKGDPLAHPRLTVTGRAARSEEPRIRERFLARHPKAKLYADFPDFGFFALAPTAGHLNGGFAKAATLTPAELLLDLTGAEAIVAGERGAVEHMNADHADALALYAAGAGEAGSGWRLTGLDPEGLDLMAGERTARVTYPEPVRDMGALRKSLVAMAAAARAGAAQGDAQGDAHSAAARPDEPA
ncbi:MULTISPECIES: HugZ family protein [unclassified Methylobacterium]|uniref:HugZ family pyridoxamine 5'-phosphate oxidase n=1 Tax=unclassified Methylobacterium TaxID=2615210 RepID=UPI0037009ACC